MRSEETAPGHPPRVAVLPGDGIGPEVVSAALEVIDAAGVTLDLVEYDLGAARYLADGVLVNDEMLEEWRTFDAIFFGAAGHPDVAPGILERGLILRIRFELDLYLNIRPFSPPNLDHDFVIIRENTESSYAGEGGWLRKHTAHEIATQGSVNTRFGVERAVRYAFELAEKRRGHVTLAHKTNVLTYAGDLWNRTFEEVAAEFPSVETWYNHVDAACIYMVEDPERYDVIVTDNLFGDILSDLGSAVSGGIGLAPTANLHPGQVSMFEPVHGSAPDIMGKGIANPSAAILSAAMMLDHLGLEETATKVRDAVNSVATTEPVPETTAAVTAAIIQRLAE